MVGVPPADFDRLLAIAEFGSEIIEPPGFVKLHEPDPMRTLAGQLGNCMQWHAHNLWSKGKALMFRLSDLREGGFLEELNLSVNAHWVYKPMVPQGRFVLDGSNTEEGRIPLNSDESLDLIKELYGEMSLPLIATIIRRIYELAKVDDASVHMSGRRSVLAAPLSSLLDFNGSSVDLSFTTDAYNSVGLKVFNAENSLLAWSSYKLPFHAPRQIIKIRRSFWE